MEGHGIAWRAAAAALTCGLPLLVVGPGPAYARDAIVRSFDDTPLVTHFFPAEGLRPGSRAPTVLVGHGFGATGETNPDTSSEETFGSIGIGPIRHAGFNVLTWDARGFGGSGGEVDLHHPRIGGRDAQALLDHVARQPEAQLDSPGDPRVGMAGSSYGGIIQLVLAAIDRRVDAIAPNIAPNSYLTALYPDQLVKAGWGLVLSGAATTSIPLGAFSSAGPQLGNLDPRIYRALTEGAATGKFSPEIVRFFDERGPRRVVARVRVPTLLTQGTVDTLFPPNEAMRNEAVIRRNGAPTKMMWFCGGHGLCTGGNGRAGRLEAATIRWLRRWVKRDPTIDTGSRFEWLADNDDEWRVSRRLPSPPRSVLRGVGSGLLPLVPSSSATGGAALIAATPAPAAVNVVIRPPGRAADVLGPPRVRLSYSGTAEPAETYLFAQVLDAVTGRIVGNQVTPIPVTLDGRERTVKRELAAIATRAGPSSRYRVQIAGGSSVYGPQRSDGAARLTRVEASLPIVKTSAGQGQDARSDNRSSAAGRRDGMVLGATARGTASSTDEGEGRGLAVTGFELVGLALVAVALLFSGLVLRRRSAPS